MFISATGADSHSDSVFNYCKHMVCKDGLLNHEFSSLNMLMSISDLLQNTSGVARLENHNTATYCAIITENGELSLGLGDMDIHQQITADYVSSFDTGIDRRWPRLNISVSYSKRDALLHSMLRLPVA